MASTPAVTDEFSRAISGVFNDTDVYGEIVHLTWLDTERKLPKFHGRSPQPELRPLIVDWIRKVCCAFELHSTCRHLSVELLDYFLDDYVVDGKQLELLALCCIQIAAKVEERELSIPRPAEFAEHTTVNYSDSLCMKMELKILDHLNWRVGIPTVAHFSCYYASLLVSTTDKLLGVQLSSSNLDMVRQLCSEYMDYLIDVPLEDIAYKVNFSSSTIACAVMAATRKLVDLEPLWPARLEGISRCSENVFACAYTHLLNDYEKAKAKSKKENKRSTDDEESLSSGYLSQGSPDTPLTGNAHPLTNNNDIMVSKVS